MTKTSVGIALLATLMMLAPLAAADADSGNTTASDRPDDAAWVEDCPPDMMCAYNDVPKEEDQADNVTRGPDDCEYCRYGPGDCIDCTGMPVPADDDTVWGTDCPPGVYCMYDGTPEPAGDDASESAGTGADTAEASAAGFVLLGTVGLVGLAFLLSRRHT